MRRPGGILAERSAPRPATTRSIGILTTYPPTQCGLATFAASLRSALIADRPDLHVGIVRLGTADASVHDDDVAYVVEAGTAADRRAASAALNRFDVAVVQHEFGIYGGPDGEEVLDILAYVTVPTVVVVHTVPARPTINQRRVLEALVRDANAVVAMSEVGRRLLIDDYRADSRKVTLLPHGAPAMTPRTRPAAKGSRPVILTWGLIGPGKGIEWGIAALGQMDAALFPTYVVAGQTHPKVLAREGESYRGQLIEQARQLGPEHLTHFVPEYVTAIRLRELLADADVVLLPYDSHEQVTSGVLTEALASGVPVVATAFPHAVELLADGLGGLLVPHQDPAAIAAALTRVISEPGLAQAMSVHNAQMTALVSWPTVAGGYRRIFDTLMQRPAHAIR
ncbi:MAG: glycosyltransferase [Hamadaea sp.]|nr:glycosyltransferase [Hamadaea sp.]